MEKYTDTELDFSLRQAIIAMRKCYKFGGNTDWLRHIARVESVQTERASTHTLAAVSCADHVKGETGFCTFNATVPFGTKLYMREDLK
jgi:hypothetical protein